MFGLLENPLKSREGRQLSSLYVPLARHRQMEFTFALRKDEGTFRLFIELNACKGSSPEYTNEH